MRAAAAPPRGRPSPRRLPVHPPPSPRPSPAAAAAAAVRGNPAACRGGGAKAIKRTAQGRCTAPHQYRDRIFIRKDIILTLAECGRLNATRLATSCGLNMLKHRDILADLEEKGIIGSVVEKGRGRDVTYYHVTEKGLDFCSRVLDPYEEMFPRRDGGGRGFNPGKGGGGEEGERA